MKHFKHHSLALIPLLSILSMSPAMLESKSLNRSIASVTEEVKKHPKYDLVASKIDPKLVIKDAELKFDKYKIKRDEFQAGLLALKQDFVKESSDKKIVAEQRASLEALVTKGLILEDGLKFLDEKKLIEAKDQKLSSEFILASKISLESIIADIEANEALVAKKEKPVAVEVVKEVKKEVSKDEIKKEIKDAVKEELKDVAKVEEKEEPKKEKEKTAEEKILCDLEEKNAALTKQVDQLVADQKMIVQLMYTMLQQNQQRQQQQPQFQPNPYPIQYAYNYAQPQAAGNWVYYPQGFQQGQSNIFSQPQQYSVYQDPSQPQYLGQGQPQPQQQQMLQQPQQLQQQFQQPQLQQLQQQYQQPQAGWNVAPQMSYGTFGSPQISGPQGPQTLQAPSNSGMSFNLSNNTPSAPSLGQMGSFGPTSAPQSFRF